MARSKTASVWILAATLGCQPSGGKSPASDKEDGSEGASSIAKLDVEVLYRERMMLPPTATLEVVLEDGAKMDVAAELVSKKKVPVKTGPPYSVTLGYEPSKLDAKGRYGVRARIENEGRLMFTSAEFNPAFGTNGSPGEAPNAPVRVLLTRVSDSPTSAGSSITGTRWVLETLRGQPAGTGAGGRAPEITLQGSEPRVAGFTGCNQISGGYTLDAHQLSFGQMAMTMRACPEGMELERDFAEVLRETKTYRIEDDTLSLRDEGGTIVATLKAG